MDIIINQLKFHIKEENLLKSLYFKNLLEDVGYTTQFHIDLPLFDDFYINTLFNFLEETKLNIPINKHLIHLINITDYFQVESLTEMIKEKVVDSLPNDIEMYDIYKKLNLLPMFYEWLKTIDPPKINCKFDKYYDIMRHYKKYYNIYNYDDELIYTKLSNADNLHPTYNPQKKNNFGDKAIVTKEEFIKKFNEYFYDLEWNNMIVAGGFIFGLLNKINNGLLENSDIDIFIYGTEEERKAKWFYLMNYFDKLGAKFARYHGSTTIIMDGKLEIQVIVMDKSPNEIIESFDFNYVQCYYDGKDVVGTISCIYGLKYQMAIYVDDSWNISKRYSKALLKGLCIEKCDYLDITFDYKIYEFNEKVYKFDDYHNLWRDDCNDFVIYKNSDGANYTNGCHLLNNEYKNILYDDNINYSPVVIRGYRHAQKEIINIFINIKDVEYFGLSFFEWSFLGVNLERGVADSLQKYCLDNRLFFNSKKIKIVDYENFNILKTHKIDKIIAQLIISHDTLLLVCRDVKVSNSLTFN